MEGGLTEPGGALRQEGRHRSSPQTHVVGLKKLLGSEALAGVRLALTPEVGGRADAEAVSSAPDPSLAVLDPGDPRPAGEYVRLSGEGEQTLGLGLAWYRLCGAWEILGLPWNSLWGRGGEPGSITGGYRQVHNPL